MNVNEINNNIILTEYDSFSIAETLECGQCFRFQKRAENDYLVIAFKKVIRIIQEDEKITIFNTSLEEFNEIWMDYFDLNRDYSSVKSLISKNDNVLLEAVKFAPGIRILNQEFFECLISFIISQNNRIPMIKKVIENISQRWGEYIGEFDGVKYYSFPTPQALSQATEEQLMECKTGFRAKYIIDAVARFNSGEIKYTDFLNMKTSEVKENLMTIKGVGTKVADCVMLFSCRKCDVFPTDVWVRRIMSHFYFEGIDTPIKEIHQLANDKFGEYAGFAQQYLFHYARQLKIGTEKK